MFSNLNGCVNFIGYIIDAGTNNVYSIWSGCHIATRVGRTEAIS